jgi:hypothetical protein
MCVMKRRKGSPARALVRAFLLAGGVSVLVEGLSCTRETFDLLAPDAGAPLGGSAAGMSEAGSGRGGSAGASGSPQGGKGGSGGGFPNGAQAGFDQFCFPGESCIDGGVSCPPTMSVCKRCTNNFDCGRDTPFCAQADGRCVECLPSTNNCRLGYACDPTFFRCARACTSNPDCGDTHQVCAFARGVCVDCRSASECQAVPGHEHFACVAGFCVECADSADCVDPTRPYCSQFHCVMRP